MRHAHLPPTHGIGPRSDEALAPSEASPRAPATTHGHEAFVIRCLFTMAACTGTFLGVLVVLLTRSSAREALPGSAMMAADGARGSWRAIGAVAVRCVERPASREWPVGLPQDTIAIDPADLSPEYASLLDLASGVPVQPAGVLFGARQEGRDTLAWSLRLDPRVMRADRSGLRCTCAGGDGAEGAWAPASPGPCPTCTRRIRVNFL